MRRFVLRRAGMTMFGVAVIALPFYVVRVVLVAATGVSPLLSLPLEMLVPFLMSLYAVARQPHRSTRQLTATTFCGALLSSAAWLGLATGDAALAPALGTLGAVGMVFLGFPLVLLAAGLIAGLDLFYMRTHKQELATIDAASQIGRRKREGVYVLHGLPRPELEAITQEFDTLRDQLEALPALRSLLDAALKSLAEYTRALQGKLSPNEITYVRYMGSGLHLYKALLGQITRAAALHPSNTELLQIQAQGAESLRVLDEATKAVGRIRIGDKEGDLAAAAQDLEDLAKRAEKY